ncbi:MAG TPA: FKBP-type peptidyl-prolyl cis-trans isomerase [Streptosporangiaceae bacterium]
MRRTAVAVIVPLITAITVAACGGSSPSSASKPPASPPASGGTVQVSGQFNTQPTVHIPATTPGTALQVKTEVQGSGPTLATGDNVLGNFSVYLWSGTTNKLLDSTYTTGPQILPANIPLTGLATALKNQKAGSRILAVLPPKYAYGSQGNSQLGVSGTDTLVWVIDVIKGFSPSAQATGTRVSNGGGSLPTVTPGKAGAGPAIKVPGGQPPSKLIVKTLIKGHGKPLAAGQQVVANYTGLLWRNGKVFSTTWPSPQTPTSTPFSFKMGGLVPGLNTGLVGIPVGSRVMFVIPPAQGYGSKGNPQAGIKGTDTLVFVFDILDAEPAAG